MGTVHKISHDQSTLWPPKMAVCVGTVVLQSNRMLFVRQAQGHALSGQWSIPWGLVDEGESPEAAALRETHEESGIRAEIDGLLGVQTLRTPGWLAIIFLGHHVAGEPVSDDVETDKVAYFSLEEMDVFDEPFDPWCEWLAWRVLMGKYSLIPCEPNNPYAPRKAFL